MEVSGKKVPKDNERCKPCHQRKLSVNASGFCAQCSEYMCQTCFDTHKQFKLNRGHRLLNACEETSEGHQSEDFDICERHTKEFIKFYCPQHDHVGCGDCMILDHKQCKVELILDIVNDFKDSEAFLQLTTDVEKKRQETKTISTSIRTNKDQINNANKMFKRNVIAFKDELIAHITQLSNEMLKIGDDIMGVDMKLIDSLEKENDSLITKTADVSDLLQSLSNQPYKLFISSVSRKKTLKEIQHQLEMIRGKNTINTYVFARDTDLARLVNDCQQLGNIKRNQQENQQKSSSGSGNIKRNQQGNQQKSSSEITSKSPGMEIPICQARAVVMTYVDTTRQWIHSGSSSGLSNVQIYRHTSNNTFRVVGRTLQDKEVVINCAILKNLKYNQVTPTFHQWRDSRHLYGLNFATKEDSEVFANAMLTVLDTLNSQGR